MGRRGGQKQNTTNRNNTEIIKKANSARYRLLSIAHDVKYFLLDVVTSHLKSHSSKNEINCREGLQSKSNPMETSNWPVFSNERCGTVGFYVLNFFTKPSIN